jgi:hypothetical protein
MLLPLDTKQCIDKALMLALELKTSDPGDQSVDAVIEQLSLLQAAHEREGHFGSVDRSKITLGAIARNRYRVSNPLFAVLLAETAMYCRIERTRPCTSMGLAGERLHSTAG